MKQVMFLRHGATAGNLQRRYIGRTDEPLCELGLEQAQCLAAEGLQAEYLFVSPMLRTRQTAEIVFPGMPRQVLEDLRETDFGIFEGKSAAELWEKEAYRRWVDRGCTDLIPGGEAVAAFKTRSCGAFLQAMEQVPEHASAAFVIHGGCIMAILEALAVPKRSFYDYHIQNGEYIRCTLRGRQLFVERGRSKM